MSGEIYKYREGCTNVGGDLYKYCEGWGRFINTARDIQMSGEIYKYREGYTNIGGYTNVRGDL